MPFIRLSDNYDEHPKFQILSDGAFRLWHQGIAYSRRFQTDGVVPVAIVKTRSAFTVARLAELLKPCRDGAQPLWKRQADEIVIHDYLEWNLSRDEEQRRSKSAKERTRKWRANASGDSSRDASQHAYVPDRYMSSSVSSSSEGERERKPDPSLTDAVVTERAGRFIERYEELYPKHRHGARYAVKPHRDYEAAVSLCRTWADDARLDKIATIFLTTDHQFAESGSRTIPQFLALASWCDSKLAEWEQKRGVA